MTSIDSHDSSDQGHNVHRDPAVGFRAFPGGDREFRLLQRKKTPRSSFCLAPTDFAAEQYDKAEKEYREVLRLAPDDPAALRQLATIYLDQGQIVQAYPLLKKSAELQPDDPEIQLKLGQALSLIR